MPNENEELTVVEEEETQLEKKPESEADSRRKALALAFLGGLAAEAGKVAVDMLAPKIKEACEKAAEKAKAKRAERKKLKEQKKLEKFIEAEKAKTE